MVTVAFCQSALGFCVDRRLSSSGSSCFLTTCVEADLVSCCSCLCLIVTWLIGDLGLHKHTCKPCSMTTPGSKSIFVWTFTVVFFFEASRLSLIYSGNVTTVMASLVLF